MFKKRSGFRVGAATMSRPSMGPNLRVISSSTDCSSGPTSNSLLFLGRSDVTNADARSPKPLSWFIRPKNPNTKSSGSMPNLRRSSRRSCGFGRNRSRSTPPTDPYPKTCETVHTPSSRRKRLCEGLSVKRSVSNQTMSRSRNLRPARDQPRRFAQTLPVNL